ncbi:uncharacterized protein [Ptychodera flava]|uniref:uncharacterized protein n=1 Tax=Ptychodera flava TaxID=63121 RepID=UPI003969BE2D
MARDGTWLSLHNCLIVIVWVSVLLPVTTTEEHPCRRKCEYPPRPRVCEYDFTMAYFMSMGSICKNCPYNLTDCVTNRCLPLDGVERAVVAVNDIIPGPAIEVCHGDTVVVHLKNKLMTSEHTTIHFHFQRHYGTPFMDGVPMITQCPIPHGEHWRYEFVADPAGTHFWHSHTGYQRADGAYGALIVREPEETDPLRQFYDFDDYGHTLLIQDWTYDLAISVIMKRTHIYEPILDDTILINGKAAGGGDGITQTPRALFTVQRGHRYRFRLIFNGISDCPVFVTVDSHVLTVVATDGNPVEPYPVHKLGMSNGERFDVVIAANEDVDNYWIHVTGIDPTQFDLVCTNVSSEAILHYEGAPEDYIPRMHLETMGTGIILNDPHRPQSDIYRAVTDLRSLASDDMTSDKADVTYYLALNQMSYVRGTINVARYNFIDWISFREPKTPLIFKDDSQPTLCNYQDVLEMKPQCDLDGGKPVCHCTYIINVALGTVVEVVAVNEDRQVRESHPMHLHGMNFRVVAMGKVHYPVYKGVVQLMDQLGLIDRNLDHPVTKDSVTVPSGGYTILRFHADNPGYWLFHCHIEFHSSDGGMALVFKVGEDSDIPDVPEDFPRCDWPRQ